MVTILDIVLQFDSYWGPQNVVPGYSCITITTATATATTTITTIIGPHGSAVERQSLASVFSPSCARLVADVRYRSTN